MEYCRVAHTEDYHATLEKLIERFIQLTPMVKEKYLDGEANLRFLMDEVMGPEWIQRKATRTTGSKSDQSLM